MRWLSNLPVQSKLGYAMLLISSVVSVLACVVFLSVEYLGFRDNLRHTVATLARISADNCTAAIAFSDSGAARQNLEALRAEPQIIAATLYGTDGRVFARYGSLAEEIVHADPADVPGVYFRNGYVVAVHPVVEGPRILGTLYLHATMEQIYERMRNYSFVVLGVLASSIGLASLLASVLRRTLARPILELAGTASAVSANQDFSLRAREYGRDELGQLTVTFNEMLDRTQSAIGALRESEGRVRSVLNAALSAVVVIDSAGHVIDWNTRAEVMFGRSRPEALGRELSTLIIPSRHREAHRDGMRHFLATGESPMLGRSLEMSALRRDGSEFPVELSISPMETDGVVTFCGFITDITGRKRSEERIRASLKDINDLKAALDEHAIVAITDPQGRITYVNDKFCTISKYPREELLGQDHRIINSGHHSKEFIRGLWTTIAGGRVWKGEIKNRAKDGSYYWVDTTIVPFLKSDGKPYQYVAIRADITERKRVEAMGEGQRLVLQLIAEDVPLQQVLDELINNFERAAGGRMSGCVMLMDGGVLRLSAAPHLPAAFNDVQHEILVDANVGPASEAARSKEPVYMDDIAADPRWPEFRVQALANGLRACWSTPILSSQGEVLGTFAMYYPEPRLPGPVDSSIVELATRTAAIAIENKRAAIALRTSEAQLRLVTDNAPILLVRVDRQHRYLFVNRAYAERNGFKASEMVGMSMTDVVGAAAYALFKDPLEKALAGERVEFELEAPYERLGRSWIHLTYIPERNVEGQVTGVLGVIRDIDARKHAELELKRARDEAEAASRAKDDFLAALSHDLRTPLNPVLLLASAAAENPDLPPAVRADFEEILKNVHLEARLIDDLLDLTRITRGKLHIEQRRCNVHTILEDALKNVEPELVAKTMKLELNLAAKRSQVLGDSVRLQQVFWNILKNAVKFTPDGGRISVSTNVSSGGDDLVLRIADTGVGMTSDEMNRVFGAFSQGDHAAGGPGTHRFGGLGLGLAITKMLVDRHGGKIQAFSAGRNMGSVFQVDLPLCRKAGDDSTPSPLAARSGSRPTPRAARPAKPADAFPRRILLVEDHTPTRQTLQHLLQERQFEVTSAESAERAHQLALSCEFDLIISDVGLPDRSGYELMADLRAVRPRLAGIALSGFGMEEDLVKSRAAGFSAHLVKPVTIGLLEDAIAKLSGSPPEDPSSTGGPV
ncbi:MAG TPA: PAS domain S-box protein [Opitutaceae bacterium]